MADHDNRYNYDYNSNYSDQRNQPPSTSSSLGEWILPLIFLFCFPPVGILLIALKLFGGDQKRGKQVRGRHPYYTQQQGSSPTGARTTAAQPAQNTQQKRGKTASDDPLAALSRKSKRLTVVGTILTVLFGFCSIMDLVDNLWMLPDVLWLIEEIVPLLCFTAGGLGLWWAGLRQKKKLRRFRQYLSMIGRRQTISISSLSAATGRSPDKVREDLQDMLDDGCFPAGFLDYGGDMLVLSADGLSDPPKSEPKQTKAPSPDEEENAVLAEIRAVNDSIAHEGLSAQIDRIGVITAKIFDYQKSHPEKSPQLHSFLSYYLPTTLKILRAYAQLEAQGIEGENITAAKKRIEGMMDKVVEGFEKQLDQLFQGDALDITTDVQVLEQMLSKDGLSGDGLQLGI